MIRPLIHPRTQLAPCQYASPCNGDANLAGSSEYLLSSLRSRGSASNQVTYLPLHPICPCTYAVKFPEIAGCSSLPCLPCEKTPSSGGQPASERCVCSGTDKLRQFPCRPGRTRPSLMHAIMSLPSSVLRSSSRKRTPLLFPIFFILCHITLSSNMKQPSNPVRMSPFCG